MIGAETGAPAAGRTAVRRDERLDRRVLGVVEAGLAARAAFAHSHETRSGTVAPTARDSCSTQSLVSRNVYFGSIGIQTWMPRLPVVFG